MSSARFPPSIRLAIDDAVRGSFDKYQATRNTGLPRLAVLAATSTDDQLVHSVAGFERNDSESAPSRVPVSDASQFPLWSATKLLTIIAALQLVERGVIRIEDEAAKFVPELRGMKVLTGFTDDGDEPIYQDAVQACTIEQLMLHTAGFSFSYNPLVGKMEKKTGEPWVYAEDATRESLTKVPYVFQPGTAFAYGSSTDWLALVVAEASGQPFDQYLEDNLFKPLGITDMTFENPSTRVDMATIPTPSADADPESSLPAYTFSDMNFPRNVAWGGAGITGSPRSYLKVLQMLLRGGTFPDPAGQTTDTATPPHRVLREETVKSMFLPRFSTDRENPIVKSFLPFVEERSDPWSHRSGKQFDGVSYAYGGLTSGGGFPSGRSKGALAWSGAANAFWVVDRTKDVAFVVWTCLIPHSHANLMDVWAEVETLIYTGLEEMRRQ